MHQVKAHKYNSWITLTYADENLPQRYNTGIIHPRTKKPVYSGSLDKTHVQKFYRKLRKYLASKKAATQYAILFEYDSAPPSRVSVGKIRPLRANLKYYYGGEYGEKYRRPHYHVCLFGIDFNDKKLIKETEQGFKLYESKALQELWPHGQHIIGELNWQTAAYTARYIMNKVTGKKSKKHYEVIDTDTGEIINLTPEFNDMSRKPGIGYNHYEKYKNDIYKKETSYVRVKGKKTKPPRYYDKLHKRHDRDHMDKLAKNRLADARENWRNTTPNRLQAEEIITKAKIKTLKQKL